MDCNNWYFMPKELVHRILLGYPLRIEFSKLMLLSSGPIIWAIL